MSDRQNQRQNGGFDPKKRQNPRENQDNERFEALLVERSELQLCATMLYDEKTSRLAITTLRREDFANPQCQTFFGHYQHAAESRNQGFVDPRDLIDGMAKSPAFSDVSAVRQWMIRLAQGELATPLKAYTHWNIQQIKGASAKRKAHETVTRVAAELAGGELTADLVASARESLGDALAVNRSARRTVSDSVMDLLDLMASGANRERALPTGIRTVDDLIGGGFLPGQFVVVGARPGGGKSSFAMQVALNAARQGKRVLFHSLEMSENELTLRWICNQSGVSFSKAQSGRMDLLERQRFSEAANIVANMPISVDDTAARRVHDIEAGAREFKKDGGLDLIVVDYLQLITPGSSSKTDTRAQLVGNIARDLKLMARSLNVPVIAPAQVNREGGKVRATLTNLREGGIENDADVVFLLHGADQGRFESHSVSLRIAKQRNGPLCDVDIQWTGSLMRFEDIPSEDVF
jgi:replicative DNA helicase